MSMLEPTKGNKPAVLLEQERAFYGGKILATLSQELQAANIQGSFGWVGV
ncbi:hypothetical protein [Limnohabitans sp.]|jgi:hypothetical protein